MSVPPLTNGLDAFLAEVGILSPQMHRLRSGRNSRVWRVDCSGDSYIVKEYFRHPSDPRDRLATEYGFLSFLQSQGITNVPQPLARQSGGDRALYTYLSGLPVATIQTEHIVQAADFIARINHFENDDVTAKKLPSASEACFSLREHLNLVKTRLSLLECAVIEDSDIAQVSVVRQMLFESLWPTFQRLEARLIVTLTSSDCFDYFLSDAQRILSPSDFGFHNMLESNGQIYFLDFEYAGWDDPAKTICDFACQPEHPISRDQSFTFIKHLNQLESVAEAQERAKVLEPLYRLKWCCILLNEFRLQDRLRREYAGADQADRLQVQLHKAQCYFNQHLRDY